MLKYLPLILLLSCASLGHAAGDGKPTEASLHELLEVTHVRTMTDGMFAQMEGAMKTSMQQAAQGQTITPQMQASMDNSAAKSVQFLKGELSWEKLEPMYLQIYGDSFTQSEVDSMLAFYKTPGGQAVINKMPVVMQNSMAAMQQRMGPLMQKLQENMQQDAAAAPDASAPVPTPTPTPAAGKKKGK